MMYSMKNNVFVKKVFGEKKSLKHTLWVVLAILAVSLPIFQSCGTKSLSGERKRARSEAQIYAEKNPALRAWGVAVSSDEADAAIEAAVVARHNAAAGLEAKIESYFERYNDQYNRNATNNEETKRVSDLDKKVQNRIPQTVKQIMNNYFVVITNTYDMPNGGYRTYVCVEYLGDVKKLVKDVADKFEQQISDDERLKIDFNRQKFQEEMEKALLNYQQDQKGTAGE